MKLTKKQKAATRGQYSLTLPDGKDYLVDWHVTDTYSSEYKPRLHWHCPRLNISCSDDYSGTLPVSKDIIEIAVRPYVEHSCE